MKLNRRSLAVLAIAAAVLCLAAVGLVIWRAQRALGGAEQALATRERLPVEVRAVSAQPNPGFEAMSAPAIFKGAAAFAGRLYLSGPAGLYAYSADGALDHIYRTGFDLPAAPLGAMRVGTLADARQPELLIATAGEGVLAFDGHQFRQIRPVEPAARDVTALLPLRSGRLLIGTRKSGLLAWDGKELRQFHPTTDGIYVTALAGDEAELWIGTLDHGLLHWRGGQTERIGEERGLPDARVEAIALDGALDGASVYVGTPVGVAEIREGRVARVLARGRYARALLPDAGALLVGQVEAGVLRVPLGAESPVSGLRRPISLSRETNPASFETVEQFLAAGDSNYALTTDALLRQTADGEWRGALTGGESLLTDRDVSSLMVASDGRVWVGYFDRGVDILPATGGAATHIEDEHIFCVNRIVEHQRTGTVAVATANGLAMFDLDGKLKQVLTRDSGLIADHVTDVAQYGDGWVAATPAGITFLDLSGAHSLYAFQGLVNNHVYALGLSPGEPRQLMVGTLGGLSLLADGAVRRNLTTANSGLKHNWITGLVPAGDGWLIGTYGGGVARMGADGAVTATEATREGVVVNPGAMLADGRLVLVGTLGQGLLVGDTTRTRWRAVTAGLPSLNVTALAIGKGVVYVGTENGLVRIAESKL